MAGTRKTLEERKAEKGISAKTTIKKGQSKTSDKISENTNSSFDESNPLLKEVVEREYSKSNLRIIGGEAPDSVPSPKIERPILDLSEPVIKPEENNANKSFNSSFNDFNNTNNEQEYGEFHNPAYDNMSKKAQKESARKMAKTIVDAYENINNVIRDNIVKTDMSKLQMKAIKGEFDMDALNVELPISDTETITVGEIIDETNQSAQEIFTCTPEFNEETEDLWTEVLKEKGLGMSPIQRLTWLYVEDLGKKGIAAWGLYKTNKEILNTAMSLLSLSKNPAAPKSTEYIPYNEPQSKPEPQSNNKPEPQITKTEQTPKSEKITKKSPKTVIVEELHEAGESNANLTTNTDKKEE